MKNSFLTYGILIAAFNYGAAQITSVNPIQNALDVPTGTNISAVFDTAMDQSSINDTTFVVQGSTSGLHLGAITYDTVSHTATLNPAQDFLPGEVVTAILTRSIRKASGSHIAGFIWNFTVTTPNGSAALYDGTQFRANDGPYGIITTFLNNDLNLDLVITDFLSQDIAVLFGNGNGTFSLPTTYPANAKPYAVAAGDLDRDGDNDCVVACSLANAIYVYLNTGAGILDTVVQYPTGPGPVSLFLSDLNADGGIDVVTSNYGNNAFSVLLNVGDGTFGPKTDYNIGTVPGGVHGGDYDADGDIDLALLKRQTNKVGVFFNDGQGVFIAGSQYTTGTKPQNLISAPLNGTDNYLDLVTANTGATSIGRLLGNGDGTFSFVVNHPVLTAPRYLVCTDMDADADLDLVVSNTGSDSLSLMTNDGSAVFSAPLNYHGGDSLGQLCAGDFNGDGAIDIAVTCYNNDSIMVYLNYGDTIPPGPPQNLTANGANPSPWSNDPLFLMNWTNPNDTSGIDRAFYKLGTAPTNNYDTTGTMRGTPPDTAQATLQGGQQLYLWLQDKAGNTNYQNNATVLLQYDTILPAGSNASSPLYSATLDFTVNWTPGSDSGGSGLTGRYDIKVKDDTLSWAAWLTNYTGISALFPGVDGHKYYFEAACRDSAGNVEIFSSVPECSTIVDTTKPMVLSHYPEAGDTNIPPNANISAKFSEPMDSSTMIIANFSIVGSQGGNYSFSTSFSNSDTIVFLNPTVNFAYRETVTVVVKRQVEDLAGNLMPADIVWQFSTSALIDTIGPATSSANATPNPTEPVANVSITALVSDAATGNNIISGAEFFIDSIGQNGTGTGMVSVDTFWDEISEDVIQVLNTQALNWAVNDTHELFMHGQDVSSNWGSCDTAVVFIIADDDTLGPEFSSFSPVQWPDTSGFYIECQIVDPSGVYDDATGSSGQGVHLLWDNDGEISIDAHEAAMSLIVGSYFSTDSLIPAQSAGANFVYRVSAYDNDFDTQHEGDRTQGSSPIQTIEIVDVRGPMASNTAASPNPTAGAVLLSLTSFISDSTTEASTIAAAEYFVDLPGADSSGTFMQATDGSFDENMEGVIDTLDISTWGYGITKKILVHGLDIYGNWGNFDSVLVQVTAPEDTIPPAVISTIPDSGQTNVSVNASIFIVFSEPLDTASLDTSKFHITGTTIPVYSYALDYDTLTHAVLLDPSVLFAFDETISVNVASTVADTSGNNMDMAYAFYFVTGNIYDTLGPAVTAKSADPDTTLGANFSDITATISDSTTGMSVITAAELFLDSTGIAGTGQQMMVVDSTWNEITEQTFLHLDVSALNMGIQWLYIHGKDGSNNWGAFDSLLIFVTPDDDSLGPAFSYFLPDSAPDTSHFNIYCTITDPSGIYDDSTGSSGQGIYMLWDTDGELTVTAYENKISLFAGDTFRTDNVIPAQAHTVSFVYDFYAYDNDFDFNDPEDRTQGHSGIQTIDIYDARGPRTSYVQVSPPNPPASISEVIVYATISDSLTGQLLIDQAEAFLDSTGAPGTGFSILALDGVYDEIAEDVFDTIPVSGWLAGQSHIFYVHGRDEQGNWGDYDSATVYVTEVVDTFPPLVAATTPDSCATDVPLNTWIYITFNEKVDPVTVTSDKLLIDGSVSGAHGFWMSFSNSDSTIMMNPYYDFIPSETVTVYLAPGIRDLAGNMMASSYTWWFRTGTQPVVLSMDLTPDTVWGANFTLLVGTIYDDEAVAAGEYFIDSIGATGTGESVLAMDSAFGESLETVFDTIPTNSLSYGTHMVYLHGADAANNWSLYDSVSFVKAGGDTTGPIFSITIDPSPAIIGDTLAMIAVPDEPLDPNSAVVCSVWTRDSMAYALVLDAVAIDTFANLLPAIGFANGDCRVKVSGYDVWLNPGSSATTFEISPADEFMPEDDVYAWPNPARGNEIYFHYYVNANADVTVDVFNIAGKRVVRLEDRGEGGRPPHLVSSNAVVWDISRIASDVYIFRISATSDATGEKKSYIKKFAIVK